MAHSLDIYPAVPERQRSRGPILRRLPRTILLHTAVVCDVIPYTLLDGVLFCIELGSPRCILRINLVLTLSSSSRSLLIRCSSSIQLRPLSWAAVSLDTIPRSCSMVRVSTASLGSDGSGSPQRISTVIPSKLPRLNKLSTSLTRAGPYD